MLRRLPWMMRCGALGCLLAAHAAAQPADASTRDTARALGLSGVEAYQAGSYEAASEKLERAYALMNAPSLGLWSARALAKRNLLVEAANRYYEVASLQVPEGDAAVQHQAQLDAQAELDQLRQRIPRLLVRVNGADTSELALSLDGQPVAASILGKPRLVNPGPHRVEAQLGAQQRSVSVNASPGTESPVLLDFSEHSSVAPATRPPPPQRDTPSSTQRTLGWVALGAGGVGIALGSVTGGLSLSKRAALEDGGCSDTRCPHEKQAEVERLNTFRTVSSVGFIAGGVLASAGVALLLTAPSREQQLAAVISGDGVTLTGTF